MRVEIHVRPRSSSTRVGGSHAGVLVVHVPAPPDGGRATAAALSALADALSVPVSAVTLLRGATSRRKLVDIAVPAGLVPAVTESLERLRSPGVG